MTTPYAGTATHHATINLIDDNDTVSVAALNDPLSALKDETNLINGILDRLGRIQFTQGVGGIGVLSSLAAALTNISGVSVAVTPAVHDRIVVFAAFNLVSSGGTSAQMRIRYSSASLASTTLVSANHLVHVPGDGTSCLLFGVVDAPFAETTTFQLQGTYIGSSGVDFTNAWCIGAALLGG